MKVTYNWLKDFIEIKIRPRSLADKLTMAGLEVTSLEERGGDFVFELEVTANRPDCLSVIGIAREVAAITGKKLKSPKLSGYPVTRLPGYPNFAIKIEDKKDCPLYTAKIIKNVKVGPSPDWLKKRLELVGCHSVNNIVDITNYILFEWGEPLHAFDLDKLSHGKLVVRRAKINEKLTTIDAEEKVLRPDILVIADEKRPVAIAGIMGGKDSEVTENTKNVLLEAAVFNPIIIRRSQRALGLVSESAYRFERGVDLEIVAKASQRAAGLIEELAQGRCVLVKSSGLPKTKKKIINLGVSTVNKILGLNIAQNKIEKILNSLAFRTSPVRNAKSNRELNKISNGARIKGKNNFAVTIPAHRPDVNLEIDLIEEIARILGYEFIPKTSPRVTPQASVYPPTKNFGAEVYETRDLVSLVKNILVGLGLNEVITYALIDKDLLAALGQEEGPKALEILNPLSQEQEILRPKLIPSLSACVAYNLSQKQDYINIFEVAKVFLSSRPLPKEELMLGIALSGAKSSLLEQGLVKEEVGFLHLKGLLEALFERLGISDYNFSHEEDSFFISIYAHKEKLGLMQRLKKGSLDKLNIKNKDVFALELFLGKLFAYVELQRKFIPLPKYPGIVRDISFILKEEISLKEALEAIRREKGRSLLDNIKITDYYKGKQIPAGYRGLTLSCLYRSDERTLTEAEINPLHTQICSILTERFGAKTR